jgi:hypothetical protein
LPAAAIRRQVAGRGGAWKDRRNALESPVGENSMFAAVRAACACAALLLAAAPAAAQDATAKNADIRSIETPAESTLQPGLDAGFFYSDFKLISNMAGYVARAKPAFRKILAQLNDNSPDGQIFESGAKELYGLKAVGYLKFPAAGEWKVSVLSNDGVRVTLGGQQILEDPAIHSDRHSPDATVKVPAAGYVPIEVLYFQRKGTAALELHWTPPGGQRVIVPKEAFWSKKS